MGALRKWLKKLSIKTPPVFLLFLVTKMGVMVPGVPSLAFENWGLEMRRYCVHRDYLLIFSNEQQQQQKNNNNSVYSRILE